MIWIYSLSYIFKNLLPEGKELQNDTYYATYKKNNFLLQIEMLMFSLFGIASFIHCTLQKGPAPLSSTTAKTVSTSRGFGSQFSVLAVSLKKPQNPRGKKKKRKEMEIRSLNLNSQQLTVWWCPLQLWTSVPATS